KLPQPVRRHVARANPDQWRHQDAAARHVHEILVLCQQHGTQTLRLRGNGGVRSMGRQDIEDMGGVMPCFRKPPLEAWWKLRVDEEKQSLGRANDAVIDRLCGIIERGKDIGLLEIREILEYRRSGVTR